MSEYPNIDEMGYFTNRSLENKEGEKKGRLLMYREKDKEDFHVKMKCAMCGESHEFTTQFTRKPYTVICPGCNSKFKVVKLSKKKK
ncbi:MAG: hypothetical protein KAJ47_01005 [Candidatus Aenigmarchaeota archaeon]|nr:hypothetical protein [Candidatus Aenigmarchaeota archaeon]